MPTIARDLLGAFRAAGGEHLQVARHELGALLLVALVDRQREQLAVGVGVDVAGAADEVRDVGPPAAVAVGHLDRVAEHLLLALGPQLAEALDRQLALLATLGVHEVLEAVHRDLAEDGRDRVLEVLGQQREPRGRRGVLFEQLAEHDRLAEHRGGLGERQRRVLVEDALPRREREVHAVAELVRERQHVAAARGVVEQHVGELRRHGAGAERAAALGRAHRRVDPPLVEEAPDERAELRREARVAVEHDLARLRVREGDLVAR